MASRKSTRPRASKKDAAAGEDIDAMEFRFYTAKEGSVMTQIRRLTAMPDAKNRLVILDIPAGGKYCACEEAEITPELVRKAMADYRAGSLAFEDFSR